MDETAFTVDEPFRFLGRTFEEYRCMFGLNRTGLDGSVLDCPGGPSSFAAVAGSMGVTATAIDPIYGRPVDELAAVCADAVDRTAEQLRSKRDGFVWDFYGDVPTRCRYLRAAAERFLADYARHRGRYVAAALPDLPFESNTVETVLSANLLFLYDDRLDREFHHAALAELARVARDEVRVFPLASLDATRSDHVAPVVDRLREQGHAVEFREVPYEFQPDVTEMLVVSI